MVAPGESLYTGVEHLLNVPLEQYPVAPARLPLRVPVEFCGAGRVFVGWPEVDLSLLELFENVTLGLLDGELVLGQ